MTQRRDTQGAEGPLWLRHDTERCIGVFGPAGGIEHGNRVEVVPPPCHLAICDGDNRGEPVVVGTSGLHGFTVHLIFEDHD